MVASTSTRASGRVQAKADGAGRGAQDTGGRGKRSLAEAGKETIDKTLSSDSEAFVERTRQHNGE